MAEVLNVYLHDNLIGTIERANRIDHVRFRMDSRYAGDPAAMSEGFSLLPRNPPTDKQISRFLGGYAPEGEQRIALAAKARIDQTDLFSLLRHYGLTMAGAVSVRSADPTDDAPGTYRSLTERELIKKLETAKRDHDLGNEPDSGRSMLPGFQPKVLIARFDGAWYQPERRAHSTHILKPAPSRRPATIHDEYYSHQLARHMGLSSFESELISYNGHAFLAIERYDRRVDGDTVHLIHQEDAAQALGLDWVQSTAKFQDPASPSMSGRPTARRIAELFGSFGDGSDIETWLRYLLYNVIVGNHDAHAKNVSIVHGDRGPSISDLYDAVPILHINDDPSRVGSRKIGDELSLAIGGEFSHHSVTLEHFDEEVEGWGALGPRRSRSVITDMLERFAHALEEVPEVPGASPRLRDRLGYNFDRISSGRPIGKPKRPLPVWR